METKSRITDRKRTKGIVDGLIDLVTGNPTIGDISPIAKKLQIPRIDSRCTVEPCPGGSQQIRREN